MKTSTLLVAATFAFASHFSVAQASQPFTNELLNIQHNWANTNYKLQEESQLKAYENLIKETENLKAAYPGSAESWIWYGIVQSSYAGAKGGLGALTHAKNAKAAFEKALTIDEQALSGSAYTSLGILYHKVPGWPIAFGSDKKAQSLLETALKINPEGIDPNYFYGEFMYDEKEYAKAKVFLEKALNAPARSERPLADEGRKEEINALLVKVNKKLSKR
ncbi:tetratricopeptide repeat protein [Pseudoalteromonas sp. G4]|uniref:tetratricopeptide repeat protein n=1 Tax=Pseudoalteromonas sp. G4 TaxID=2992761 RepID=UPI00237DDAB7|nr:hypothetical protein [Pseudoalteromonas sp. G4]MDE3270801.1 hypothetical protein [Pseudoalteromonas sp. G4]